MALDPDGQINTVWKTGACPYHLALSLDGRTLAVANRGGTVVAPSPEQGDPTTRQPFTGTTVASANSAGTPVQIDPRTDVALVGTVSLINLGAQDDISSVAVGRQPSGMAFSNDGAVLYVANSDEDSISIVDPARKTETARISISPKEDPTFGQIPTAIALSPDGKRIYVTLGGANAVAVLENGVSPKVIGYVPTAPWYPIAIAATPTQILLGCSKGIGSRPSNKTTGFYVHDSVGVYQAINLSDVQDLRAMTRRVAQNNAWTGLPGPRKGRAPVPVPERIGEPSVFTHVVYIIKENLSYDIAMGDMSSAKRRPLAVYVPRDSHPELPCPSPALWPAG